MDRRNFMGAALGAAAGAGAAAMMPANAQNGPPNQQQRPTPSPPAVRAACGQRSRSRRARRAARSSIASKRTWRTWRVDGKIPADLEGAFYRTGPDPQYPLRQGNIPFDGEGHVSMFRIKDGRVHYRSRYARNERYLAQEKAHRLLFPMYRNIYHG